MCGYLLNLFKRISEGLSVCYAQRIGNLEDARPCFSHYFWNEADPKMGERKWCGNANQLTVFRRCVVKDVIAEDTELCTRGVIGRRVGFKFPFLKKSFGSSPNGCMQNRDERET